MVAGTIAAAGAVLVLFHLSVTAEDYSRCNIEWNGTSLLFDAIDAAGGMALADYSLLSGDGDALLLVIAPVPGIPHDEMERVRDFLSRGNTVLVATDREEDNAFISGIGGSIRVREANVVSVDRLFDDPSSVVAFPARNDPLSEGLSRIACNDPVTLEGGTPVFSTSLLSFEDADGDSRLGGGEVLERFPVVSRENVGAGTLYVVSDPSIFINGMLSARPPTGNAEFVSRVLALKPRVLVDQKYSRTAACGPLTQGINLVKGEITLQMAIITLSMLSLGLFLSRGRRE
ncbi:MAG: DUF4350 domain-containing protein [Methanolinea sp.]|nr:DUF4350 domain-containing protein [Methanolinea sp.]